MEILVARQPIYDRDLNIYGYEILYRNSEGTSDTNGDGDYATAEVLVNSFYNIGLKELTNNTYSFINFSENLLISKIPKSLYR